MHKAAPTPGEIRANEIRQRIEDEANGILAFPQTNATAPTPNMIAPPAVQVDGSGYVTITRRIPVAEAVTGLQKDLDAANSRIEELQANLNMQKTLTSDAQKRASDAEMELEKMIQETEANEKEKGAK